MKLKPALGDDDRSGDRKNRLHRWLKSHQIKFKNIDLLNQSFVHTSWANEQFTDRPVESLQNNQRLEFLGDSVLGLAIAGWLYENYPQKSEGDLAKIKSYLASSDYLAPIAQSHGLGDLLLLGKGEENSGGRLKKNILADTLESFFGALFLDQGWKSARELILDWLEVRVGVTDSVVNDYKSLLQERCLKLFHEFPRYDLLATSGPEHRKQFQVSVSVKNKKLAEGQGSNKKQAEQEAAARAWKILNESHE